MKYIKLLLICCALVHSAVAMSHTTEQKKRVESASDANIIGHVTDKETGEHLPFIVIGVKGSTIATTSDATGHFMLKNLPVGDIVLEASYVGYMPMEITATAEKNKTNEVNIELKKSIIAVDEVVVTGSRTNSNRKESSSIVNVVSAKLFEKTASNTAAEVLNYQPGLRVEYNCSNCGVPQLRINGLEGQYSQLLLDSRPIFSSLAGVYGLEQLPAGMIERIEVIRGGGSALFGSSAIGGVVNIITKEPVRNTVTISNNTGIYGNGKTDVNTAINGAFVTDDSRAGVYVFGMLKDRQAYDRDNDGYSEVPELNSQTIGFRGYYKTSKNTRLLAEYHHISEYRRGGNKLTLPPHEADLAEQLKHRINGGGLQFEYYTPDNKHRVNVYTSLQHIKRDSYFGTHQDMNAYGNTKDLTFVAGGQYTYNIKKFWFMPAQFTVGAEYTQNNLNDTMLGYNRILNQFSQCYGVYAQNEWKSKKLSLLIGGRLDKHNKVKNAIFSPRVNVRYNPISEIGMRVSYASGYRAPQAYDEDLHVAAVGGEAAIIVVDPNLKPEYSQSVSGSVDLYKNFGGIETNLLIEGFYTDLRDVFVLQENGHDQQGNLILERKNASGARIAGVNLDLKVGFTPQLILDAGFTMQKSRYKENFAWSQDPDIAPQKRMLRSPDNYGYVTLNYNPIRKLQTSLTANYTGSMLVPHYAGYIENDTQVMTPCFWDLGLRLAYDIVLTSQITLQVSGGVKNALDAYQKDIDKGVDRDSKYIYGPIMPRTYFVGLKFVM